MPELRLNDADKAILSHLEAGRVTAAFLDKKTDWSRNYLTQRLKRLEEHGIVNNLEEVGLYDLDHKDILTDIE